MAKEKFGEKLPDQCPPAGAGDTALSDVYRLVSRDQPDDECFASKLALGIDKPASFNGSDCEWASCSLSSSVEALLKIKGLRKRNKFVATLQIPAKSGRHLIGGTHIHFWRFSGYSLTSAVTKIEEHGRS